MPEPVPAPTDAQIVTVAEMTMLSVATVTAMIAANTDQGIVNAQWARTLEDIEAWPTVRDQSGNIKKIGPLEFFEYANISTRLDFRNMIRIRYGQPILLSESGRVRSDISGYAVAVASDW